MKYISILILILSLISCSSQKKTPPKAIKGVIDLSNWDLNEDGFLNLDGEWEFYWKKLIKPEEYFLKEKGLKKNYLNALKPWNSFKGEDGKKVGGSGFGTYVLKIENINTSGIKTFALITKNQNSAYSLYLIEKNRNRARLLMKNGRTSSDLNKYVPQFLSKFETLGIEGKDIYLLMHVANSDLRAGGFLEPIKFGSLRKILSEKNYKQFTDFTTFGILLIMFLYHIGLFALRKEDKASLLFAIFCFVIGLRLLMTERYIWGLFNIESATYFAGLLKIEFITVYIATPSFYHFMNIIFKNDFPKLYYKVLWWVSLVFSGLVLITPSVFYTKIHPLYLIVMLVSCFIILVSTIIATFRKRPASLIALSGWIIFVTTIINDALVALRIIVSPFLIPYGLTIFVLSQSYIISRLFAKAYKDLEITTKAKVSLEELDKQKTRFFQNVSHELRTPLTLIMSPLDEIKKVLKDNEYVDFAIKNSNRLFRLINQLLDFQKVTRKDHKVVLQPVNLSSFVNVCADYFRPICKERGITFSVNFETNNDVFIMAQIDALEKIVFNFLSNAIKFTKEGDRILLNLREVEDTVEVSVKDSGLGIKEDDLKKLFKAFSQVGEGEFKKHEGTGLGLALAKELAELMKGKIGAFSKGADFGSTFWVKFPLLEKQRQVRDILFVNESLRKIEEFEKIIRIKTDGFSYITSKTYEEAKGYLKDFRFKTVLFSADIPGENPRDLFDELRDTQENATLILVTGKEKDEFKRLISKSPNLSVIAANTSQEELRDIIVKAVEGSKLDKMQEVDLEKYVPKGWHLKDQQMDTQNKGEEAEEDFLPGDENKLVLVVDDLKDMRELIKHTLKRKGYGILTACDGVDALEKIKDKRPDIIITDWMMPRMSGVELIEKVNTIKEYSSIPVVLLTAKSDEESKNIGSQAGANAYIGKPFDELELFSVVDNLFKLKEREKEVQNLNIDISQKYLKRFLPPQMVNDILNGKEVFDEKPNVKYLTIMNIDFPLLKEKFSDIGPKNVSSVINYYISIISDAVYRQGGCITKFDGESLISFWGAPINLDDMQQSRAVYKCVNDIFKGIKESEREFEGLKISEVKPRVAINYDLSLYGSFGSEDRTDYLVIGPSVDITYKLRDKITPGEIIYTGKFRHILHDCNWRDGKSTKLEEISKDDVFFKLGMEVLG